jgi:hypothetical protein
MRAASQADRNELAAAVLAAAPEVKLQLLQHLAAWGCVFDWRSPLAALPRSIQEYFTRRPGDVRVLCQHPGMQLLLQLSCDVPEGAARVWLDWVGGGHWHCCCGAAAMCCRLPGAACRDLEGPPLAAAPWVSHLLASRHSMDTAAKMGH